MNLPKLPGKSSKENQPQVKARIDSKAEIIGPLDFSFKEIISLNELKNDVDPRYAENHEPKKINGKYASLSINLGYNALNDITGLYEYCTLSFAYPEQIYSLDLSFNCFVNIPNELIKFQGLKSLFLHANRICDLAEVDKLKKLSNLTTLTLHGNPCEGLASFRHYVLSRLPKLRHLNFSGVSRGDQQTALVYVKTNKMNLVAVDSKAVKVEPKKKRKTDEDAEDV